MFLIHTVLCDLLYKITEQQRHSNSKCTWITRGLNRKRDINYMSGDFTCVVYYDGVKIKQTEKETEKESDKTESDKTESENKHNKICMECLSNMGEFSKRRELYTIEVEIEKEEYLREIVGVMDEREEITAGLIEEIILKRDIVSDNRDNRNGDYNGDNGDNRDIFTRDIFISKSFVVTGDFINNQFNTLLSRKTMTVETVNSNNISVELDISVFRFPVREMETGRYEEMIIIEIEEDTHVIIRDYNENNSGGANINSALFYDVSVGNYSFQPLSLSNISQLNISPAVLVPDDKIVEIKEKKDKMTPVEFFECLKQIDFDRNVLNVNHKNKSYQFSNFISHRGIKINQDRKTDHSKILSLDPVEEIKAIDRTGTIISMLIIVIGVNVLVMVGLMAYSLGRYIRK